jgi:hypothetical protein
VVIDILNKLLLKNSNEREYYLVSLGQWSEEIPFVESEQEIARIFERMLRKLIKELGKPEYLGKGSRYGVNIPSPINYFEATESALQIAWWKAFEGEIALFHTGQDADSLQFVILAISNNCTYKTAYL